MAKNVNVLENPVKAALALAEDLDSEKLEKIRGDVVRLNDHIHDAENRLNCLFGIETVAGEEIRKHRNLLRTERKRVGCGTGIFGGRYARFSLEPLTWRDAKGYPRLALFSLQSPKCEFGVATVNSQWKQVVSPELPGPILACYKDILDHFWNGTKNQKEGKIQAEFSGVIPETTRAKVFQASPDFEHIFVAAEVTEWSLTERVIPRPGDPLVLGYAYESLWLIDSFDLTPLEDYLKSEFTV